MNSPSRIKRLFLSGLILILSAGPAAGEPYAPRARADGFTSTVTCTRSGKAARRAR